MISVMLAISHVVMLSLRIAHSSINTLHKIDSGYIIAGYVI